MFIQRRPAVLAAHVDVQLLRCCKNVCAAVFCSDRTSRRDDIYAVRGGGFRRNDAVRDVRRAFHNGSWAFPGRCSGLGQHDDGAGVLRRPNDYDDLHDGLRDACEGLHEDHHESAGGWLIRDDQNASDDDDDGAQVHGLLA